jgi:hypothetical protein
MGKEPFVTPADSSVLTINGGSSSMWFALYDAGEPLRLLLDGKVDRIGLSGTNLIVNGRLGNRRSVAASTPPITARRWVFCWIGSKRNRLSRRSRPWDTGWYMA